MAAPLGFYVAGSMQLAATPADAGYYVSTTAGVSQTPAALGTYVASAGQSSQTLATPGYYVSTTAGVSQTAAAAGYYVAATGGISQTAAAAGYYVSTTAGVSQTPAAVGYFVATTGQVTSVAARAGYYVSTTAGISETAASVGYFVNAPGSASQTPATPGYFVSAVAQTAAQAAQPGYYVSTTAASSQTPTSPGYYVNVAGAAAPMAAPLGFYVAGSVQLAATPANAGYYVSTTAGVSQTPAALGTYVASAGQSSQTLATPGYYVSTTAGVSQTAAAAGYYVAATGGISQTAAAAGYYVSTTAGVSQTPAAVGYFVATTGQVTSVAARAGYYVSTTAGISETAASVGYFVNAPGSASQTPATPGYFVSAVAQTAAQAAQPGYYVSTSAAVSQTPSSPGYFVSVIGAATQTAAPLGYYVAGSSQLAAIPADPGYYVPTTAGVTQTAASAGYFVNAPGLASQTPATPGYFVSTVAQTAAQMAMPGYYVPTTAATSQTAAAEGFFVALAGASAPTRAAYSYFVGQTASTEEPLTNNNPASASLQTLNIDNKTLKVIQTLLSQRSISNNAQGSFDINAGQVLQLSGTLTGSGTWTQSGAGDLVLNSRLPGSLQINSGTATSYADIAGNVGIAAGASFQAGPTVGSINNQGTLKVGATGLTIAGALTTTSGSTTKLQLNSASTALNVQGNTQLAGTLTITAGSSLNLQNGQSYSLVHFGSSYSGTFGTVNMPTYAGFALTPHYTATDLTLQVDAVNFALQATTPDQLSAARVLDQARGSATGDLGNIITSIANAAGAAPAQALQAINPRTLQAQTAMRDINTLDVAQQFRSSSNFSQPHSRGVDEGLKFSDFGMKFSGANPLIGSTNDLSAWALASSRRSDAAEDQDMGSRTNDSSSQAVGFDFNVGGAVVQRLGLSVSKMRMNTQSAQYQAQEDTDMATAYGLMQLESKQLDAYAFVGQGKIQQVRTLELTGLGTRTANATVPTLQYGLGARLQWLSQDQMLQPFVAGSVLWRQSAAFSESNAGAASLSVDAHGSTSQNLEVGLSWRSAKGGQSLGAWTWLAEVSANQLRTQSDDVVQRLIGTTDMRSEGFQRNATGTKMMAAANFSVNRSSDFQLTATAENQQGQSSQGLQFFYRLDW